MTSVRSVFLTAFLLLIFLFKIPVAEGNALFGNLADLTISGTISAVQYADRHVDVSIRNGNLRGTVTADKYHSRDLSLSVSPSGIVGSFASEGANPRFIDFEIHGNTLEGMVHADGVGYAGPPGDAGQRLSELNMKVDDAAGVVYLEVKAVKGRSA